MKTKCWIHFIGKSYYTINTFISEAKRIGISRAVAPTVLRKMNIGDIVLLTQKDGVSTKIFGYFMINNITGLSSTLIKKLESNHIIESTSSLTPMSIKRGCGSYNIVATYTIDRPEKLMEVIQHSTDEEIGRVMIGGEFRYLYVTPNVGMTLNKLEKKNQIDYVLTKIPFRKGFRLFNFSEFRRAFNQVFQKSNHVKLKGQFYATTDNQLNTEFDIDSTLFEIKDYQLN
jgi:hypothetical protein